MAKLNLVFLFVITFAGAQAQTVKDQQAFTVVKPKPAKNATRLGYSILIGGKKLIGLPDTSGKTKNVFCRAVDYRVQNLFDGLDSAFLQENATGKRCRILDYNFVLV